MRNGWQKNCFCVAIIGMIILLSGCGQVKENIADEVIESEEKMTESIIADSIETGAIATDSIEAESIATESIETESIVADNIETVTDEAEAMTPQALSYKTGGAENGYLVVIDPGHQAKGNATKEPIGPGAAETKAKVTGGTCGVTTGIAEHQLNLEVSILLREELEKRGYQVIMTRESADVDISNSERAMVANNAKADAFLRIHANGSENSKANGIITICMTRENPYNASLYDSSSKLAGCILDHMLTETKASSKGVWETDSMSGINWCSVPVTIIEMGFMSNPEEDSKMADNAYRLQLVKGMADGLDTYFSIKSD